ncbi:MAG: ACT domain-containing protein [Dethiobacteria bacterium]
MVKQISIFLENKCGRLVKVTQVLGKHKINIRALTIADTSDFGILRIIVDDPDRALTVLKEEGFIVTVTEVIAVEVPDHPGGLARILEYFEETGINIEYLYSFVEKPAHDALILMRLENAQKAMEILKEKNINILDGKRIYSL